ncbi:MAG TPA: hypothetical protein PLB36_00350 [Bacillota bacterium]|nr:hypothetical protein [Candidatus Fermentithermobacillaceae bacterium]HOB30072.1 hypothetical protein [Bacillota bacterium]HOK63962.1 hypothetical protein [Bacillota bacterium]HOL11317.1 hypothetical protein [Bacillota bacterium]HOQ02446.1 hypothetical protein [Bacillota bacterium]
MSKSKIEQMAYCILANPNITARELAEKLGYSEPKSIYYWLEKAGFRGLKDFKKTVLSRSFPIPNERAETTRDRERRPTLPLYFDNDSLRQLDLKEYIMAHLGPRSFAVLISEDRYGEVAKSGDLLIIDPDGTCGQGDLLLANQDGRPAIARVYYLPDKSPIYIDVHDITHLLSPDFINGKIIFILNHSV